jgi:hypothetical protein
MAGVSSDVHPGVFEPAIFGRVSVVGSTDFNIAAIDSENLQ